MQVVSAAKPALMAKWIEIPLEMGSCNICGIQLKIDKAGRIVVPKFPRERLGFRPDSELEVSEQAEGVFIKRSDERPAMIKVDGLEVHHGVAEPRALGQRHRRCAR